MEGSGQFRGQLGFLLQTLGLGVVVQSGSGEEVVDHGDAVVLPCGGEKEEAVSFFNMNVRFLTNLCSVRASYAGFTSRVGSRLSPK